MRRRCNPNAVHLIHSPPPSRHRTKTLLLKVAILLRVHNASSVDPIAHFARTEDEIGSPMILCTGYWIPDPTNTEFNVFSGSAGRKWIDLEFAVFGQEIHLKVVC